MPLESKMKLRSEILSILSKYNSNKQINSKVIKNDIETLAKIENKDLLAKILMNEILTGNKNYAKFCSLFILRILDKKEIENHASKILSRENITDEKKVFLLSILKQKGIYFSAEEVESFICDLDKTANDGVRNFLESAIENPEAQIDLLDFYQGITYQEKISLLNNLAYENKFKETINAFSVLCNLVLSQAEIKIISDVLLTTDSKEAIFGLENILKSNNIDETLTHKIKKKIKELKFKNPNCKKTTFTNDSKFYKSFVCFVDGGWNFSLIFSRIDKNNLIDTFFTTINIDLGITSVIGFYKIPKRNFDEILGRLFIDSPPIEIEAGVLASLLDFYKEKNSKTNSLLPFEYNVWANLISDIKRCDVDISEYLNSKLTCVEIKEKKLYDLFNSKIVDTWFYVKNQDPKIEEIFSIPNKQNIKDFAKIEDRIIDFINDKIIKDDEFINAFKSKLLLQAYISKLAKFTSISNYLFSICYKTEYIKMFLNYIFQKSICNYLLNNLKNKQQTNIFKKSENFDFTEKETVAISEAFKKRWQ